MEKDPETWKEEFPKTKWVQNIIKQSEMSGDIDKDTRSLMKYAQHKPRWLRNEYLHMDGFQFTCFLHGLLMHCRKPADCSLTNVTMKARMSEVSGDLYDFLQSPRKFWDDLGPKNLVFRMAEKPEMDLSITDCAKIVLESLLATVFFYLTTKNPDFLALDDYPKGPSLKSSDLSLSSLKDSSGLCKFKLLMKNLDTKSLPIRLERKNQCYKIFKEHCESSRDIIRNDQVGVDTNWPTGNDAIIISGLKVDLSSHSFFYEALDRIFDRKVDQEIIETIRDRIFSIEATNRAAAAKGAKVMVPLNYFKAILAVLESETDETPTVNRINEETEFEPNPFKMDLSKVCGTTDYIKRFEISAAPVILEDNKVIKWKPKQWIEGDALSLQQHIEKYVLIKARVKGVRTYANMFRLIYYVFGDEQARDDFAQRHLSRMNKNTQMSKNEFDSLAYKVALDYHPAGVQTFMDWRKKVENPDWIKQKSGESLSSYVSRMMKATSRAYPQNYATDDEQQYLCRKIIRGMSNNRLREAMTFKCPDKLTSMKDPRELVRLINEFQLQTQMFQYDIEDDDDVLGGDFSLNRMERSEQVSRSKFIRTVCNLRREKSKNMNIASDGDYIVRRADIPDHVKNKKDFRIKDFVPPDKFSWLTKKCEAEANKQLGTNFKFGNQYSSSRRDSDSLMVNQFSSVDDESSEDSSPDNSEESDSETVEDSESDDREDHMFNNLQIATMGATGRNRPSAISTPHARIKIDRENEEPAVIKGLFDTGAVASCITEYAAGKATKADASLKIQPFDEDTKYYGLDSGLKILGKMIIPKLRLGKRTKIVNTTFLVIPDSLGLEVIIGIDIINKLAAEFNQIVIKPDGGVQVWNSGCWDKIACVEDSF